MLVALCFACAVASSSLDGTSTLAAGKEKEKERGGGSRLTGYHLRNVGDKVFQNVDSTTLTEETVNDDIDLRELNGGVSLHFDVASSERDRKIERDNADSLDKQGNDKSLSPLRDIHPS